MKTPAPDAAGPSSPTQAGTPTLASLRAEIDALDLDIHDLLMRRAGVVERVKEYGNKTGVAIRPGREAAILRRLLGRHQGSLPRQTIIRIWREYFAGALIIEGGLTIAVVSGGAEGAEDLPALAREHFGPYVPIRRHQNPAQALADLTGGAQPSSVAVLPIPREGGVPWWTGLGRGCKSPLSVVGRLPFWTARPEGLPVGEAFMVANIRCDPSGQDRGLIALEFPAETSRNRIGSLLGEAGFNLGALWLERGGDWIAALADVDGLVAAGDERLAALAPYKPLIAGGYAKALPDQPGGGQP